MTSKALAAAKRPDPNAALIGALLALAGVFHMAERLGISGDELGVVLGSVITIAGIVRDRMGARSR